MKKCMICMVLLCLILCACATGVKSGEDTPGAQKNAAPIPTTVVTMSPIVTTTGSLHSDSPSATTIHTTRPTCDSTTSKITIICSLPQCYGEGHTYENGICKYCEGRDPNYTGTYPTENFCAGGHTYAGPFCVYCLAVNPDCAECESTHTYQNGYCIYCQAVDATYDFCAQGHTYRYGFCIYCGSTDPNYNPCAGGHVYQNGYCIYCLKQQPSAGQPTTVRPTTWPTTVPPTTKVYVDYICQLGAGHTFENGRCIYCGMKGSGGATSTTTRPTTVPICNSTPSRPTTCGLPQCYGKGHTYEKGYCIYCLVMDPNYNPCAGGHTFENGFCIYCATADPAMQKPTTQPGTSYITDWIVPHGEAFENRPMPGAYVMKEVDGQFYIDFGKDNKRVILDAGCIRFPRDITFASAEEMYRDLMTGDLTIEELQIIRAVFPLVEGVGFQLPNPKDVYGIPVPDGMELIITVSGSGFVVTARTPVGTPHEQMMHVQHTVLTEEEFKEKMEHFNRFEQGTVDYTSKTLIPERNAVEYRLSRSDGFVDCHVQYVYEADGKTIYVEERYPAEVEEPSFITVYGVANGEYYKLYMPYVSGTPTAQWLMQFQKIPYTAE